MVARSKSPCLTIAPRCIISITAVMPSAATRRTGETGANSSEVGLVSLLKKASQADADADVDADANANANAISTAVGDTPAVDACGDTPAVDACGEPGATAVDSAERPLLEEGAASADATEPTTAEMDVERSSAWAASVDDAAPSSGAEPAEACSAGAVPVPAPENPDHNSGTQDADPEQPPAPDPTGAPDPTDAAACAAAAPSPGRGENDGSAGLASSPTGTHLTFEELMGEISSDDDGDGDFDEPPPMDGIGIDSDSDDSDYSEPPPMMQAVRVALPLTDMPKITERPVCA